VEQPKLAGVSIRLKDGTDRQLSDEELLKMFPPGPHPETDFDAEEVGMDVMRGKPDPPGITEAEREFRRTLRAEMREAGLEEEDV
jgi:hypothetical protein